MSQFDVLSLPQTALEVIHHYQKLEAAPGVFVRCPYYRSPGTGERRWGLVVFSGKGSPQDIEEELRMVERLEGVQFVSMSEDKIVSVMRKRRLGVDCSGFLTHVLDAWTMQEHRRHIWSFLKPQFGFFNAVYWLFRPLTHMSVRVFASPRNAIELSSFQDVRPGDLMAFFGEIDHIAVVTHTYYDRGTLKRFDYAHSTLENGTGFVKEGSVECVSDVSDLSLCRWREEPDTGRIIIEGRAVPHFYRLIIF